MDGYPFDLILTVAIASATLFLGFLPTKNIRPAFFARETLWAALAWFVVAVLSPSAIRHYPVLFGFLCLAASWQFRQDNLLNGKMWLCLASAFGISVGVILVLTVTPRADPPGLPQLNEILLLVSIYLGGAIVGLAYVGLVLTQSANAQSSVTHGLVRRYAGLLLTLTLVHTVVIASSAWFSDYDMKARLPAYAHASPGYFVSIYHAPLEFLLAGSVLLVLPLLAFLARRATRFSSHVQPTRALLAICLIGFLTEILARLFIY